MQNLLVILGTRPEAIKLAPVILELESRGYRLSLCNTEQQKELSNQTLAHFGLRPSFRLDCMREDQSLCSLQARILSALEGVLSRGDYKAVIVQGDTMSAFCGGLASFYHKLPFFHVEAGLRSKNLLEPFPEEALRVMLSRLATLHFTPTPLATKTLLEEGVARDSIIESGNTVLDALFCLGEAALEKSRLFWHEAGLDLESKLVLATLHRRENHGARLDSLLRALARLASDFRDHNFVLPVHPNPRVKHDLEKALSGLPNVLLCPPLDYPNLVTLMKHSRLIITDSGGLQEEAPSFGVPLLVTRYQTERPEGVTAGFAKLVGANCDLLVNEASKILSQPSTRLDKPNPYGDGRARFEIARAIEAFFALRDTSPGGAPITQEAHGCASNSK